MVQPFYRRKPGAPDDPSYGSEGGERFKVTARFKVLIGKRWVECVRVRGPGFRVVYYSLEEFKKRYEAEKKRR